MAESFPRLFTHLKISHANGMASVRQILFTDSFKFECPDFNGRSELWLKYQIVPSTILNGRSRPFNFYLYWLPCLQRASHIYGHH